MRLLLNRCHGESASAVAEEPLELPELFIYVHF